VKKGASPSAQKLLERGAHELANVGISNSKWEAERLLRHALGWTREFLLAHPGEPVHAEASGHFFQLVERRKGREPLQYIIGEQEFWGMALRVTPAVLIPRPETEGLVEQTIVPLRDRRAQVVDVGCGSGCIALALASELPDARIYATEISPAALAVARENASRHEKEKKVEFLQGNLLEPLVNKNLEGTFDAIVTNPPYLTDSDMKSLEPEVRGYEPRLALEAGTDGLSVVRRLLPQAEVFLKRGGRFILEVGINMENPVRELIDASGLSWKKTVPDLQGIPRVMVAKK
jgi:release factor glutamine methyltransferase